MIAFAFVLSFLPVIPLEPVYRQAAVSAKNPIAHRAWNSVLAPAVPYKRHNFESSGSHGSPTGNAPA